MNLLVLPSPPVLTAAGVVNAASTLAGPISAGELLLISGLYFGPAQRVNSQVTGVVPTSLSDTVVLFEGVPAPVLWVNNGQAEVVAPFFRRPHQRRLAGVLSRRGVGAVGTDGSEGCSRCVHGRWQRQRPGQGHKRGWVGKVHFDSGGARRQAVVVYHRRRTVESPPGFDGRIVNVAAATLVQDGTVQIGGQPATVTLAGDAEGQVQGYTKVDVTVRRTSIRVTPQLWSRSAARTVRPG
jgi:hypothetical protein